MVLFFNTQMKIKIKREWAVWIGIPLTLTVISYVMYMYNVNSIFPKMLIVYGVTIALEVFCYDSSVLKKIFVGLISNPLLGTFDIFGICAFQAITGASIEAISSSTAVAIITKVFAIAAVLLFSFAVKKGQRSCQLEKKEWILLILFVGLILFVMVNLVRIDLIEKSFSQMDVLNELALFVLLCLVFYIIQSLSYRHALEQDKTLLQQQVEEEERGVQALTETHQAIRSLSHDFRDHLVCVQEYLKHNDVHAAVQYLDSISLKADHEILPLHTNNIAIDAILNEKYLVGVKSGISFQYAVGDLSQMPLEDIDVVTILANALNNAIEVCGKLHGEKKIFIQMGSMGGQFIISVKNPVEQLVKIHNNQIATTKKDKFRHGVGLTNVQMVVDKYHGDLFLSCNENKFEFLASFADYSIKNIPVITF